MPTWFVAVAYVTVIYATSYCAAPRAWLDRENPAVLKIRCLAVIAMGVGCLLSSKGWTWAINGAEILRTLIILLPLIYLRWASSWTDTFPPRGYVKPKTPPQFWRYLSQVIDWTTARDLFVGPFAEECVFRVFLRDISSLGEGQLNNSLVFALAHAHPILTDSSLLAPVIIQCAFTFLFGLYSYRVYGRTRSLTTCWIIHSMCNAVGFPDLEAVMELPGRHLVLAGLLASFSILQEFLLSL